MPPYGLYSLANTPEELLQGYGTVTGYDTDPAFGELQTDIRFQPAPFTGARPFQNMFDLSPNYFQGTDLGFDANLYNPSFGGISGYQIDADDIEMVDEKAKETKTGIETLLGFLQNFPNPLNLITGGLQGIQNFSRGLQNTTFGRSKTLADYFDRVAREKNRARFQDKFEKFAKETSGQGATGGEGGFSTPAGKSTSYEEASRAFGRDR